MDSPTEDEVTKLEEICLVCLTEKYVHLEHCKECHKCIRHFHMHSKFFNACFGDANIRPYFLFQFLSLTLCFLYIYLIGRAHWTESTSKFFLGKLMLTHYMMSNKVLTAFLILEVYTVYLLDRFLLTWSALGHNMTINEFSHAQNYRYLFEVELVKLTQEEKTFKYAHKSVSFCRFMTAPLLFFFACSRKPLHRPSE